MKDKELSEEIGNYIGTYKDNPPFVEWRDKAQSLETELSTSETQVEVLKKFIIYRFRQKNLIGLPEIEELKKEVGGDWSGRKLKPKSRHVTLSDKIQSLETELDKQKTYVYDWEEYFKDASQQLQKLRDESDWRALVSENIRLLKKHEPNDPRLIQLRELLNQGKE